MATKKTDNPPGIEIDQDLELTFRFWRIQRFGWLVMLIIIILALIGTFGTGLVARAEVSDPNFQLTYDRFSRYQASTEYKFIIKTSSTSTSIAISNDLIEALELSVIVPEPESMTRNTNETIFNFTSPEDESLVVTISGTNIALGKIVGEVVVADSVVPLNRLIYP